MLLQSSQTRFRDLENEVDLLSKRRLCNNGRYVVSSPNHHIQIKSIHIGPMLNDLLYA